jgi:small subunit ribosomal protein S8
MSLQDPLSDMLTRIRNAQGRAMPSVSIPSSKLKVSVAEVLKEEGYIADYRVVDGAIAELVVSLKYHKSRPVIEELKRISRPGLRAYKGSEDLPKVRGGLGVAIVSTSAGVMTDREARAQGIGGEVLCTVF